MVLLYHDPGLYKRDCRHCWKYVYEEAGEQRNKPMYWRANEILERDKGHPPPCVHGNCKKGHIDRQHVLTKKQEMALWHYHECKASGNFPEDSVVRRHAVLFNRAISIIRGYDNKAIAEFLLKKE